MRLIVDIEKRIKDVREYLKVASRVDEKVDWWGSLRAVARVVASVVLKRQKYLKK